MKCLCEDSDECVHEKRTSSIWTDNKYYLKTFSAHGIFGEKKSYTCNQMQWKLFILQWYTASHHWALMQHSHNGTEKNALRLFVRLNFPYCQYSLDNQCIKRSITGLNALMSVILYIHILIYQHNIVYKLILRFKSLFLMQHFHSGSTALLLQRINNQGRFFKKICMVCSN